jgi:hypothetical protein
MVSMEPPTSTLSGRDVARAQAMQVIGRWRCQGFDVLVCHPSGYCSPANSHVLRPTLPDEYTAQPLESDEALMCLLTSIVAGASYRL